MLGDYAIYFITITLGVAVFYAFNSIGEQDVLFDIRDTASSNIFDTTEYMLSMVSYVMIFVLGFLIVYANRFLIRRRKREFGTYLVLGMTNTKVASIVLVETIAVGLIALAVGLGFGILLAQGLSFLTAALFGTTISHYQFIFSFNAFTNTLICFALIFVLVAILNIFTVSKMQLISLLQAQRKPEKSPVRNPWICLVVFAVSIATIALAYHLLAENRMQYLDDPNFIGATVAMLVGSLLFFWSLSGLVIAVLTHLRGIYLRGLVPFTVRQFAAKANSAWLTLWVTCILVFFAITIFSTGLGLMSLFVGGIESATPYDVTFRADPALMAQSEPTGEDQGKTGDGAQGLGSEADLAAEDPASASSDASATASSGDPSAASAAAASPTPPAASTAAYATALEYGFDMLSYFEENLPGWDSLISKAAEIDIYEIPGDIDFKKLFDDADYNLPDETLESIEDANIEAVALSQFNRLCELSGSPTYELDNGQYLIANSLDVSEPIARDLIDASAPLDIDGTVLRPLPEIADVNIATSAIDSTVLVMVVPDGIIEAIKADGTMPKASYVDAMYVDPGAESDDELHKAIGEMLPDYEKGDVYISFWPVSNVYTQVEMRTQANGLRFLITYLALYIGFILLVATAALLTIQQLTEAADSAPRYRMLSKIGCDNSMLNRSLFVQILVYFLAPLLLAACHSACAIAVMNESLFKSFAVDVMPSIISAALFTVLIYGIYLVITYLISKRSVHQKAR